MSPPTLPAGHEEYGELAVAWAIAALEPAEQDLFEEHLAGCPVCAGTVADALRVATELAYAAPEADPPADLRGRIMTAAAATPPAPPARAPEAPAQPAGAPAQPPGSRRAPGGERGRGARAIRGASRRERHGRPARRRVAGLAAAAVVAALGLGATWQVAIRGDGPPATVAVDRVATLGAPVGDRAVASVVVRAGSVDVVTDALPPNTGRGTAYVLWGVPTGRGGAPTALGTFDVTRAGLHSYPVRLVRAPDGYPVLAVSEEPAGTLPPAPSAVLARGALGR